MSNNVLILRHTPVNSSSVPTDTPVNKGASPLQPSPTRAPAEVGFRRHRYRSNPPKAAFPRESRAEDGYITPDSTATTDRDPALEGAFEPLAEAPAPAPQTPLSETPCPLAAPPTDAAPIAPASFNKAPVIETPAPTQPDHETAPMPNVAYFAKRFGLRERPFTLLPDPDFIYWTPAHTRAFAILEYGVMARAPITVITGEVGAGKTTLLQKLLQHFEDDTVVGLISNAQGGRGDLLQWALNAFDAPSAPAADYVANHQAMQNFLIERYAEGKRAVLIIDEAQNLSMEGLEELRMMTNINAGKDELLQLILVGQPELREMITQPELRQFAQRVSASFHLPSMDLETTIAYIRHRLVHAGGTGQEFNNGAIALIHRYSGGIPRLVNKYADFAMVYSASSDLPLIDEAVIYEIVHDGVFLPTIEPASTPEVPHTGLREAPSQDAAE